MNRKLHFFPPASREFGKDLTQPRFARDGRNEMPQIDSDAVPQKLFQLTITSGSASR
jgi:hypothetical protein